MAAADAPSWRDDDAFRGVGGATPARAEGAGAGADADATTPATAGAPTAGPPSPSTPPAAGGEEELPLKIEIPRCRQEPEPDNPDKQYMVTRPLHPTPAPSRPVRQPPMH